MESHAAGLQATGSELDEADEGVGGKSRSVEEDANELHALSRSNTGRVAGSRIDTFHFNF